MQNFDLIIDFKIQNLQIHTITKSICLDIYYNLNIVTNPLKPQNPFYDFQISFVKTYQQTLKSKCPICLDINLQKAFKLI